MALCSADFERGTNGNTVATSDAGSNTAWDTVSIVASGTNTYDNAQKYGALSNKNATGATSGANYLAWNTAIGTPLDHYGRVYIYHTTNPAAALQLIGPRLSSGGAPAGQLRITTAGKVELLDSAGTQKAVSTNSITLIAWVRLEYHFIHSTTAGQLEVKIFNSPDSTTATETATTASNINTGATFGEIRFGQVNSAANTSAHWLDNIRAGDTAYPGPATLNIKNILVGQAVNRAGNY